jgi:SAM-dependent methyltransferase
MTMQQDEERPPFGVPELLAAVAGATRVLDAGCGSGRLTVALARTGADTTGFDQGPGPLADARRRADEAGLPLALVQADFNGPLPFADGSFDAATSRLALMVADDPVATLRELRRVLEPGGRIATAVWAVIDENPWFGLPRQSVAAVLGDERARFARAFGRLGDVEAAARVHRDAGLEAVDARMLRETLYAADTTAHWQWLTRQIGHFRRVDADLSDAERAALLADLDGRLAPFAAPGGLALPRAMVLVTARR